MKELKLIVELTSTGPGEPRAIQGMLNNNCPNFSGANINGNGQNFIFPQKLGSRASPNEILNIYMLTLPIGDLTTI
jgi:hypothetical protein